MKTSPEDRPIKINDLEDLENVQRKHDIPKDDKLYRKWERKPNRSMRMEHFCIWVCILLNPSSPFNLSSIQVDPEGRFLIAKLTIEEKYFFITNIYGPNNFHNQDNFIKTLSQQLGSKTDTSKVILYGDWNITLNRTDKLGGLQWKATSGRNTLVDLMEELNLTDVYRELYPKSKSFTYVSKSLNLKSRSTTFLFRARIFAILDKRKFVFRQRQTITRSS